MMKRIRLRGFLRCLREEVKSEVAQRRRLGKVEYRRLDLKDFEKHVSCRFRLKMSFVREDLDMLQELGFIKLYPHAHTPFMIVNENR